MKTIVIVECNGDCECYDMEDYEDARFVCDRLEQLEDDMSR